MKKLILLILFASIGLSAFAQSGNKTDAQLKTFVNTEIKLKPVTSARLGMVLDTLIDNKLNKQDAGGGVGTVSSVALTAPAIFTVSGSPITTSGTLGLTLGTQSANTIWSGPTTGGAATPTFRSLVASDIPSLSSIYQTVLVSGTSLKTINSNSLLGSGNISISSKPHNTLAERSKATDFSISLADTSAMNFLEEGGPMTLTFPDLSGAGLDKVIQFAYRVAQDQKIIYNFNGNDVDTTRRWIYINYRPGNNTYYASPTTATTGGGAGTLTEVTGVAPISVANGTTAPDISIADGAADGSTKGAVAMNATYFDASSGVVNIDLTNGAASGAQGGYVTTGSQTIAGTKTFSSTISGAISGNAGTATTLQTTRAIYGNNFDGSAALTQIIASTFGGTGNGFTKFSGPTTSEKTFTLPNASSTILTDNAAVTVPQGGTGNTTVAQGDLLYGSATNTISKLAKATSGTQVLTNTGTSNNPAWSAVSLGSPVTVTNDSFIEMDVTTGDADGAVNPLNFLITTNGFLNISKGGTSADNSTQTYTPTLNNTTNVGASTAIQCFYFRIGNVVHISGQVTIDPTTTLTLTTLGFSIPIASNFTTANQAGGTFSGDVSGNFGRILSDATNDRLTFQFTPTDVTNLTYGFTCTYQLL